MVPRLPRLSKSASIALLLVFGPATLAQAAWVDPRDGSGDVARPSLQRDSAQLNAQTRSVSYRPSDREQAARDLAFTYLRIWSEPNRVALPAASSFYGRTVRFHGRTRTIDSVLAEKRRFAERWPDRTYRYRPETAQVMCEARAARCTVWAMFDFSASNSQESRRSRGIGEHELVVSLAGDRPIITAENSRVLRRGAMRRR